MSNEPPRWSKQLDRWLGPFLDVLGDKRRRRWAPLYITGLLLPGESKSMQPISSRVAPKDVEQIHHFVATSCWDTAPLEEVLWQMFRAAEKRWLHSRPSHAHVGESGGSAAWSPGEIPQEDRDGTESKRESGGGGRLRVVDTLEASRDRPSISSSASRRLPLSSVPV